MIRRKPAHCSNALAPSRGTFFSSLRLAKGPCSFRYATMFSLSSGPTPATRLNSAGEAVLTSTPTAFTQSSTTASRLRSSFAAVTSCWYCPTPIDFGSIFTSSASGSCSRRAIETAPRRDTSMPGSSAAASADAEYTDAPASDTTIFCGLFSGPEESCLSSSAASLSVSLDAVPLPIATSSTPCFVARPTRVRSASSHFRAGACG
ncbi:hypothetical protein SRABI128_04821 [Microbacterium sp. Bi128]|nr:hypothetical protein SRABI128_04821 [Microbacterium sp. Bi128]